VAHIRADEMTEDIIARHNELVAPGDYVYFVGDLAFWKGPGAVQKVEELARRLNGNIFWIFGNHDKKVRRAEGFEWKGDLKNIQIDGQHIVLSHYSMRVWNRAHYGSWNLYGHSHGSLYDDPRLLSFDVGVDANDFTLLNFGHVKEIMKLKSRERDALGLVHTHHGRGGKVLQKVDMGPSVDDGVHQDGIVDSMPHKSGLTVYLDMDGVVCCLTRAVYDLFKEDDKYDELYENWPLATYDMTKVFGIESESVMWNTIDAGGPEFWQNVPEFPWFQDLYDALAQRGRVVFLTSPSCDASSLSGKLLWLQDRFGKFYRDYIITNKKHLLAHPKAVLVDDSPAMVKMFRDAGGQAVLFPQPWNGHTVPDNVVDHIVSKVEAATR
jgi:calcineurin-like phosphoesterase family protein/5'(3')-deoxyribonucleotidase